MNKALKKSLSVFLSVMMVLSVWVFAPTVSAADITVGNNTASHVVSDYLKLNKKYSEVYLGGFAEPLDGTNGNPDMIIPGLGKTDDMVPQGLAFYPEKNWVLTTSYIGSNSTHTNTTSVIYALDFTTGKYVAKINLNNPNGSKFTAHAGGIAVSKNNLYICNSGSSISYISLEKLAQISNGSEATLTLEGTVKVGSANGSTGTSYLSFEEGVLWTGNFYQPDDQTYGTAAHSSYNSLVLGYDLNGFETSAEEWKALSALSDSGSATPSYVIAVPNEIYDIQSLVVSDNNIYIGTSWGRKNNSGFYVGRLHLNKAGTIALTLKNGKKVNAYDVSNIVSYVHLPMCEGMFMYKDASGHKYIYNGFESAAYYYYGYKASNVCKYPTDVVWKIDADALYSDYLSKTNAAVSNSPVNADSGLSTELVASKDDEPLTRVMKDKSNSKFGYVYYASYDNEGNLLTDDSYYARDYFFLRASNHSTQDITITKIEADNADVYVGKDDTAAGTSNSQSVSVTVPAGESVYFKVRSADSVSSGDFSVSATYSMKALPAAGTAATGQYTSSAYFRAIANVVGNAGNYKRYYNGNKAFDVISMAGINKSGKGQCTALPIWKSTVTYNSPADISRSMDGNDGFSKAVTSSAYTKYLKNKTFSTSMSDYDSSGVTTGATTKVQSAQIYYNINSAKYKNLLSAKIMWSIGIWEKAPNGAAQHFGSNAWNATSADKSTYGTVKANDILEQYPILFDRGTTGYRDSEKVTTSVVEAGTTDTYLTSSADLYKNPGIYTVDNDVQAWHGTSAKASNVFGKISVTINAYNASALMNLVHKCENTAFVSERYNSTLWETYQKAISAAMNKVGAYGQTQAAMDKAYTDLESAYNALLKADSSVYSAEVFEISHDLYAGRAATREADNSVKEYVLVADRDTFTPSYIDDGIKGGYTLSPANKVNERDAVLATNSAVTSNGVSNIKINYYATAFKVTFENDDGSVLEENEVYYGQTPVYSGRTPEKLKDSDNHYSFAGWNKEIVPVEENTTYTATYTFEEHNYTGKITKEASCTEPGVKTYTCSVCSNTYTEVIPAKGHTEVTIPAVEATCKSTGLTEGKKCSVCGEVLTRQEVVPMKAHTPKEAVIENEVKATCSSEGSYDSVVYCSVCNTEISRETVKTDKLAHTYVDVVTAPTCTEKGYTTHTCSVCGDSYIDSYTDAKGHTETVREENRVEASCGADGSYDLVTYCSVCGNVLKTEKITISATGEHNFVTEVEGSRVPATCITEGKVTMQCGCGATKKITLAIDPNNHENVVTDEAVAATCETAGKTEGKHCGACNTVIVAQKEVKALGHNYVEVVTAPTCTTKGFTTHTCSACGNSYVDSYVDEKAHTPKEAVVENEVKATCTSEGSYDSVVYCSVCDTEISRETVKTDKLAHTYVDVVTAPTCTADGYTTHTCSACGTSYVDSKIPSTGHTSVIDAAIAATCETAGKTEGSHCSVCGEIIKAGTETAPLGHNWGAWTKIKDSTCFVNGEEVRTCSRCTKSETRALALAEHHSVVLAGKEATCTETGLTDGTYCDVCGKTLSAQKTIPAKGHDDSDGDGKCDICGAEIKKNDDVRCKWCGRYEMYKDNQIFGWLITFIHFIIHTIAQFKHA